MPIKGAVVFILVSNAGVELDGKVHVYRPEGTYGDVATIFLAELQAEMKTLHIPHSVTIPFPYNVRRDTTAWFEANSDKLEKIIVICSTGRENNVSDGIPADLPIELWTFDGRHEPDTVEPGRRYFGGCYPRENFPDNDGITRMLMAMEEEKNKSFFDELKTILCDCVHA